MERIAKDFLKDPSEGDVGNKYILVISDCYTLLTDSHPMYYMEANTDANILMIEVTTRFWYQSLSIRIGLVNSRATCSMKCAP